MASSAVINRIVEEINAAFGGFRPERLMPDVENFLENLPEVFKTINEQLQKVSGHMESDMPVNGAVSDALNEVRPHMDRAAEAAEEAFETFKRVHEDDRKRYHEPRTQEHRANVD